VSRQAGWISPVIVQGGVVAATWRHEGDTVSAAWFVEAGRVPHGDLEAEVARLSHIMGRELRLAVMGSSA
jgi:hypothetical protein